MAAVAPVPTTVPKIPAAIISLLSVLMISLLSRWTLIAKRASARFTARLFQITLGRVDGFNQDEAECKGYEGSVVLRGLLASERDAFEALEFADGLLDACPRLVEYFRKECRSIDRV